MKNASVKAVSYCLSHVPDMAFYYGNTPWVERHTKPGSDFLQELSSSKQDYNVVTSYAPNLTYIGAMSTYELADTPSPWLGNLKSHARYGKFGQMMPEDEFIGLMDICDVFDIIWLEKNFSGGIRGKFEGNKLFDENLVKRLEAGHEQEEIKNEAEKNGALPLYCGDKIVGCVRKGHDIDENLAPYILLENLASKAGAVLSVLHILYDNNISADEIDFVIECSEEAVGDMNQRGGGNMAKAIAEIAGCSNASGCDIRGFCAAPVNALMAAAAMVSSSSRKNVLVVAGGAVPKLYMNAREHVKKGLPAMEDMLSSFAALIAPENGKDPVIRLDALGKHTVAAGSSPQAVTSALVYEPLEKLGLGFKDIDKYAAELHIPEITLPAGAGDVPLANFKMIAALAVMKKQLERQQIDDFVAKHGVPGFAHTQGHIPSGVPFLGHACADIKDGKIKRAMIIGKGSLFLGRMTNLSDGASFILEAPSASSEEETKTVKKIKIGLMSAGSEHGATELIKGAKIAAELDENISVVMIGPKPENFKLEILESFEWIETENCEKDIADAMEEALNSGKIKGAVALHYAFPVGVATFGRVITPSFGKPMILASTTGTTSQNRAESLIRNAIYGKAVALALGIKNPSVGILNLYSSSAAYRAINKLKEAGYDINLEGSAREDKGTLLRGNDILTGETDVCVVDTLTGNVLMKMFSSFNSGGVYETTGWGYGPSVGEGWDNIISIISRASGAPVIANALSYTLKCVQGELVLKVKQELAAAKKCGLEKILAEILSKEEISAQKPVQTAELPPKEPTDSEISGIDVLDAETAANSLLERGIYAEAAMGCTGPVIKIPSRFKEKAKAILQELGYI